jgi:hypothetical protein
MFCSRFYFNFLYLASLLLFFYRAEIASLKLSLSKFKSEGCRQLTSDNEVVPLWQWGHFIRGIRKVAYRAKGKKTCQVCDEPLSEKRVVKLHCDHIVHFGCFVESLGSGSFTCTCDRQVRMMYIQVMTCEFTCVVKSAQK